MSNYTFLKARLWLRQFQNFLLEYYNPMYRVYRDIPEGRPKKGWWRGFEWQVKTPNNLVARALRKNK